MNIFLHTVFSVLAITVKRIEKYSIIIDGIDGSCITNIHLVCESIALWHCFHMFMCVLSSTLLCYRDTLSLTRHVSEVLDDYKPDLIFISIRVGERACLHLLLSEGETVSFCKSCTNFLEVAGELITVALIKVPIPKNCA